MERGVSHALRGVGLAGGCRSICSAEAVRPCQKASREGGFFRCLVPQSKRICHSEGKWNRHMAKKSASKGEKECFGEEHPHFGTFC